ncbi:MULTISPECIES: Slp family lipoprotein [Vibrio]|uniref:Slp/YeaY family lipoprotein n=2 Tax=Vibrio TaxID=662 RepID=A0A7X4LKA0_9VIBR|nr:MULTISPECIES: Slp/YeaY family lipoprotein [Vibrio]MBF8999912.1 Slp/YeaY family lipoprotein [Vibrio nitrifigilis]MZI93482.1 Slp/YeaY family lipoprotein [Vibrio eleionomae]
MKIIKLQWLIALLPFLFLTGCVSMPPELAGHQEAVITDYHAWTSHLTTNSEVRLGGVIAGVSNLANKTRLEIVNLPIDKTGRPNLSVEPKGRFIAYVDGFLDPVSYSKGRLITVIGQTMTAEKGHIGDYKQTFPVMRVTGEHLWKVEERVIMDDLGPNFYRCRGFYCRHFEDSYYSEGRVIKTVK